MEYCGPSCLFLLETHRLRVSIVCALCLCLHGEFARRDVRASNIPFGFFILLLRIIYKAECWIMMVRYLDYMYCGS